MQNPVYYLPLLTTIVSAYFFVEILKHWLHKPKAIYLLWWTLGVFCYGAGTFVESFVTLGGWSENLFVSWYIFGALLGGVPLAQGTVHLLFKPKFAKISSLILISVLIILSLLVMASPIDETKAEAHRLSGDVMVWSWIRGFTPIVNLYAFVFLVGGAIYSARQYYKKEGSKSRFQGNVAIALGGLLPGIGGSFTKFGHVEVLYVTELIGIILIFWGYRTIRDNKSASVHQAQTQ
ncbi:MAG: hypothetical protein LPK46_07075 [Bacteroidota bacterium]|nr:hypothetical protein [Bacteroidota bacterium]MDX5505883.1 hypothetical protein [Bacteroidota bacterium]